VSVSGIEQAWHNDAGVAVGLTGEVGTRGGELGDHGAVSAMLAYRGSRPGHRARPGPRMRRLQGQVYSRQMVTATQVQVALPSGFTVLTDLRMSLSRRREAISATPNRYTESSIGLAWRMPRSDAPGDRSLDASRRPPCGGRGRLARAELGTRRGGPRGHRARDAGRGVGGEGGDPSGRGWPSGDAVGDDPQHAVHEPCGLPTLAAAVPVSVSSTACSRSARPRISRSGWLNELSYDANEHTRFGVGYNFSHFSGDPLVREQANAGGWFIRARSRY
jgi:hypothetical protein